MAEYLAPGVYIEEIPSANKPIQGASTSTAGMVGMTERGPINMPTLVTSRGDYARKFGGDLDPLIFTDGRDGLPYAAEGFFTNGGSRLYVVRIVGTNATQSTLSMLAADTAIATVPLLAAGGRKGDTQLLLTTAGGLTEGYANSLLLSDGVASEAVDLANMAFTTQVEIGGGLPADFANASTVTVQDVTQLAITLTGAHAAGVSVLTVDSVAGIAANGIIMIHDLSGDSDNREFLTVQAIDDVADPKTITLAQPLVATHAGDSILSLVADGNPPVATTLSAQAGASAVPSYLQLASTAGIADGVLLLLDGGGGTTAYVTVTRLVTAITLATGLGNNYPAGATLTASIPILDIHARWPGSWGDRLRATAGSSPLVKSVTSAAAAAGSTSVTLVTAFGLFPGSVITLAGSQTAEVESVNAATGLVTLTAPLVNGVGLGDAVVSGEFSLLIERLDKVSGKVVESEFFDRLSMASEHPRYALKLLGSWNTATARPSDSGASQLIRLTDNADGATRVMPFIMGLSRRFSGGSDDLATVNDTVYVGQSGNDPISRTGIQALENEPAINIVAVPGRTSVEVQKALVDHCEKMRYRFAAVDVPLGSTLEQARAHRQNFDSTRVAVYYPALVIADRFRQPGDRMAITSSGHMLGVWARTDNTRGVHKAPANEVIQGILGFETALTKGEQDILNPINLNCHRDFRSENRGLRAYGARVATSDPEWKYINVRRLLLFIEQSLDNGLQWAVFEPNDQRLWDQVRQSVTGFLDTVWRSGALEGQIREEAFFVNIGYNITMEQADIDNGRLIVEIGVAPVKPAEYVIARISQKTREATS
ncbi:MAG: phage tail sheath subtilisin-like domain-containing protein [Allorhizobium sp.]